MKNKIYYSAKKNGFYPEEFKEIYESSVNGWPEDAVQITHDEYNALLSGQSTGQTISPGKDGKPALMGYVIDYKQKAEFRRQELLSDSNKKTSDWRTELELGIISDDDKAQLIKWMTYIKDIKALDLTSIADKAAFDSISWPNLATYSL